LCLRSQSSTITYFPGFVFRVTLMSRFLPLLIRIVLGSIFELTTRVSPRCEQPAITASLPPPWYVHLGTTRSVALGADGAGLAMAALAGIVAARHIEVLAVTAATAAAKVRFNFPPG